MNKLSLKIMFFLGVAFSAQSHFVFAGDSAADDMLDAALGEMGATSGFNSSGTGQTAPSQLPVNNLNNLLPLLFMMHHCQSPSGGGASASTASVAGSTEDPMTRMGKAMGDAMGDALSEGLGRV